MRCQRSLNKSYNKLINNYIYDYTLNQKTVMQPCLLYLLTLLKKLKCFVFVLLKFSLSYNTGHWMIDRAVSLYNRGTTREPRFILLWSFSYDLRLTFCFLSRRERLARVSNASFLCCVKSLTAIQNIAQHHTRCAELHSPWKRNNL